MSSNPRDLLIRGGRVFDGLGKSLNADLLVVDGKIAAIGQQLTAPEVDIIDARNLWVTPGFVDIHTHYDLEVELSPGLAESVRHGVTSVIMGGCSLSTTFGNPSDLADIFSRVETLQPALIQAWLQQSLSWTTPASYFTHLKSLNLGPNVACMLGHSTLRTQVMGLARALHDKASTDEIQTMRSLATEALDAGCIGISVDMVHWHKVSGVFAGRSLPSHYAQFDEYAMLADVCRSRDAVFQVTPNPENLASFWHIFRLSPGIWRAPLRNTVLAALDMDDKPQLWRIFPVLLWIMNRLFGCNTRFQTLSEPFLIFSDGHLTPFFEEFAAGVLLNNCKTVKERKALWHDPAFKQQFEDDWFSKGPKTFHRRFDKIRIVSAPDSTLINKTIADIALSRHSSPMAVFMSLLEEYDESLRWVACNANNRPHIRQRLMKHPHIFPGFSDAGAHGHNLAFFDNALSTLRQAVTHSFMSPERAVSRVTGEVARWFQLNAGQITLGAKADIVILDPKKLSNSIPPPISMSDPILKGACRMVKRDPDPAIKYVFIKGACVIKDGSPLPLLGTAPLGRVLTQINPTRSAKAALERYRNRITDDRSLSEDVCYWHIFLCKHQDPRNVFCHMIAFVLMYAIPLFVLLTGKFWGLCLMPTSQMTGLIGHWLFERTPIDQRDTVFSYRAFICLHKMFFLVIRGQYAQTVLEVKQRVNVHS